MTITIVDDTPEAEIPFLKDIVPGSVDFKNRSSVRSKSGKWRSAAFIIAAGVAERFGYYGISSNLVSYLTLKLGMPTASAAASLNAWYGVSSLLPIFGAFVADSFIGRFGMIIVASVVYIAGLCFLALSTTLSPLRSSECNHALNIGCSANKLQLNFFFFSLYLVSFAQSGFTPCVQAFGADQFDDEDEKESKAKNSFFNWWYCLSVGGIMVPLLCLTYIQENVSWELGFGIPAFVMCLALIVFLIGTMTYRFRVSVDQGNPFSRIVRVFFRAVRNWHAPVSVSLDQENCESSSYEASHFRFLDRALLASDASLDQKICSASDVEDARGILRLAPIWFCCLGYSIVFAQPSTLFTKQAATLDLQLTPTFRIPAASLQQYFITITIMLGLPLYDRIFVPITRSITKNPSGITMLQRIGFGLFLSLISILFAALVERKRLTTAREYGLEDNPGAVIPMSALWLAPQYLISAVSDVFAMVGLQEFFYNQVPSELKSIGLSMYLSILGIGSLVSSFLVSYIQQVTSSNGRSGWFSDNLNRAHLDYFYWLLTGICTAELVAFVYFARSYTYRRCRSLY